MRMDHRRQSQAEDGEYKQRSSKIHEEPPRGPRSSKSQPDFR